MVDEPQRRRPPWAATPFHALRRGFDVRPMLPKPKKDLIKHFEPVILGILILDQSLRVAFAKPTVDARYIQLWVNARHLSGELLHLFLNGWWLDLSLQNGRGKLKSLEGYRSATDDTSANQISIAGAAGEE